MTAAALPHDPDAERAILGAILVNGDLLAEARGLIQAADFYGARNARIYRALLDLAADGEVVDIVTVVAALRESGKLEDVGGAGYISGLIDGIPRSSNISAYCRIVREKARRRAILSRIQGIVEACENGATPRDLDELLDGLGEERIEDVDWKASDLADVTDPKAGIVEYYADKILPRGQLTTLAAGWKTGKTFIVYRLVLDLVRGAAAFDLFDVREAVSVAVFQLEMPASEDSRRLRRLAIGAGMRPEEVLDHVRAGRLTVYNRPPDFTLTTRSGCERFHAAVQHSRARVVVVDSALAAMAGTDINDNSAVRQVLAQAFDALTSEGVAVVLLHHRRKASGGARDADRDAVLGAQAFGGSSGNVYGLDRLDGDDNGAFRLRLSATGAWVPEGARDVVLMVSDTQDGGTLIRALDEPEQLRAGGIDDKQRSAIALANLVRIRRRVPQKDAVAEIAADLDLGKRTVEAGLAYAKLKRWITTAKRDGGGRALDLVPGPVEEDER